MRKKNGSFMELIQEAHASGPSTIPYEAWARHQRPLSLESYQLALIRPKWATFRMERAFWSAMEQICEDESIAEEKFITWAIVQYPHYALASAVRLGIFQYYRQFSGLPIATIVKSLSVLPAMNPPRSKLATTDLGALHVLVVDDVAMNRDFAGSFLRAAGHKVTCVEGGAEAIAAIKTTDFDVVLMDVRMPEMDGLETTRRIRRLAGARGRVPIVALTARAFAEQVAECLAAGMDSHVAKPFTPDTLLIAVLRAVGMAPPDSTNVIKLEPVGGCYEPPRVQPAAGDISFRIAVALSTGWSRLSDLSSEPARRVIGLDKLVLDQTAFERTAYFLPAETIDAYVGTIAARAEALLSSLSMPDVAGCSAVELAEAANAIAGSAGMFGFDRLTHLGCCFERAVESGSADSAAIAEGLRAALQDTLGVIGKRTIATAEA